MFSSGCGITLSFFCLQQLLYSCQGYKLQPSISFSKLFWLISRGRAEDAKAPGSNREASDSNPATNIQWKSTELIVKYGLMLPTPDPVLDKLYLSLGQTSA
jgi:hypothetical protein